MPDLSNDAKNETIYFIRSAIHTSREGPLRCTRTGRPITAGRADVFVSEHKSSLTHVESVVRSSRNKDIKDVRTGEYRSELVLQHRVTA